VAVGEQRGSGERGQFALGLDVASLLRAQVRDVHRDLDDYLTNWLRGMAPASPPAGSPAVALYVHAATVEDLTVHSLLCGIAPVYESNWAGKGPARYSTTNLTPVRAYAQQVFAATDAYLAGLAPAGFREKVDLSRHGLGQPTVAWVVSKFVVLQLAHLCGELTSAIQHP
jgi:hypothetical protein